jgi:hypothetical protein
MRSCCAQHLSYPFATQLSLVCQQRHDRTRYGEDIGIPIRKADQLQAKRQAVIFEHRE